METTPSPSAMNNAATATLMEQVLYEVKRVVVGQDRFLERVLVALLAGLALPVLAADPPASAASAKPAGARATMAVELVRPRQASLADIDNFKTVANATEQLSQVRAEVFRTLAEATSGATSMGTASASSGLRSSGSRARMRSSR